MESPLLAGGDDNAAAAEMSRPRRRSGRFMVIPISIFAAVLGLILVKYGKGEATVPLKQFRQAAQQSPTVSTPVINPAEEAQEPTAPMQLGEEAAADQVKNFLSWVVSNSPTIVRTSLVVVAGCQALGISDSLWVILSPTLTKEVWMPLRELCLGLTLRKTPGTPTPGTPMSYDLCLLQHGGELKYSMGNQLLHLYLFHFMLGLTTIYNYQLWWSGLTVLQQAGGAMLIAKVCVYMLGVLVDFQRDGTFLFADPLADLRFGGGKNVVAALTMLLAPETAQLGYFSCRPGLYPPSVVQYMGVFYFVGDVAGCAQLCTFTLGVGCGRINELMGVTFWSSTSLFFFMILKALGVTPDFNASELRVAGFSVKELLELPGWTLSYLKKLGYSAKELKDAGCSAKDLKDAGYSAKDLKDAGYSASDLKKAGYSAKDLKDAGYGCSASDWKIAGYSASDLIHGYFVQFRFSFSHLQNAGYSAEDMAN